VRRILHIDMDAFFAAVEVVHNPALRGKPLIVGGERGDTRGVVSTASYEARRYGVHSAMPIAQALKLCPHGIFMRGNPSRYREASRQVREILASVTPQVEMASIDEAYLDVTGSVRLFQGDRAIADHIREGIHRATGLPCTIAIAPNKLVAKIASAESKPAGYCSIEEGEAEAWLAPLAVAKLPGAGPKTCARLEGLGIPTLGALAAADKDRLARVFGEQTAMSLQRRARGISDSPVTPYRKPKSISKETTFPEDSRDWPAIETTLFCLAERCMTSLRNAGLEARRITLKVRYRDFETRNFSKQLSEATAVDHLVVTALRELLPKARERNAPVRLIGLGLENLCENQHQLRLFDGEQTEKWERALASADALRKKHGPETLRSLGTLKGREERK